MKLMVIPIVIGALGTVTKELVQGLQDLDIRGRVETIQTTALLRLARIPRGVLETWGDLLSLRLQWRIGWSTEHLISARRPDLVIFNKKKRTHRIVDFDVPADHRVELKESENRNKYQTLPEKWKKLWNIKVTMMPIVIGAHGTVTKGLVRKLEDLEIRGRVETIQTTALLRSARIPRGVLQTWGDLLSLKFKWKNHQLTLVWKTL